MTLNTWIMTPVFLPVAQCSMIHSLLGRLWTFTINPREKEILYHRRVRDKFYKSSLQTKNVSVSTFWVFRSKCLNCRIWRVLSSYSVSPVSMSFHLQCHVYRILCSLWIWSILRLSEWLNVQQSVQLPFALLPLLFFNCNPRVMGKFRLGTKWQIFFWIASLTVIGINVYLTLEFAKSTNVRPTIKYSSLALLLLVYVGFLAYLSIDFCQQRRSKFTKRGGEYKAFSTKPDARFSEESFS